MLSPLAARKAEKLGYKNVKVFHAGIPAWKKAGNLLVSTGANIDKLTKVDASYILVDGSGVGELTEDTLTDRRILGEEGFLSVVTVVDTRSASVVSRPAIQASRKPKRSRCLSITTPSHSIAVSRK